jgi:hypothetical protein
MLNQTFEGVPLALMKRVKSNKKSGKGCVYSTELKSFALTLQFYSAKAYSFDRKTFNLALPSQSQIWQWYSKIPADPGNGVSLDQAAPGPTGIGCPQGGGSYRSF